MSDRGIAVIYGIGAGIMAWCTWDAYGAGISVWPSLTYGGLFLFAAAGLWLKGDGGNE